MTFFEEIPAWVWWMVVLIIIIFIIYIWRKLPFDLQRSIKSIFRMEITLPIIFIGSWWYWHSKDILITENQANWWMPIIIGSFILLWTVLGKLKYHTKQFITPNFHGSYTHAWVINNFVILNIGGISAPFFPHIPLADKIAVVRVETFLQMQNSAISIANLNTVHIKQLDEDVERFIKKSFWLKRAKNNIWYGWFDCVTRLDWIDEYGEKRPEFMTVKEAKESKQLYGLLKNTLNLENPSVLELFRLYKNANKRSSKQADVLTNVIDDVEEGTEHKKKKKRRLTEKEERPEKVEGYEG